MLITTKVLLDALLSFCWSLTLLVTVFSALGAITAYCNRLSFRETIIVTLMLQFPKQLNVVMAVLTMIAVVFGDRVGWSFAALTTYAGCMVYMRWERWTGKIVTE